VKFIQYLKINSLRYRKLPALLIRRPFS